MRNNMIGQLGEDHVVMGLAKGLSDRRVRYNYAARNAMLPSVTAFALTIGSVMGGSLVTEVVFNYPGTADAGIWPRVWWIGAAMVLLGGYWFWFFIRVDVAAEGHSPFRVVRADLFILSMLASVTLAVIWAACGGGAGWLFWLYLLATAVLFFGVKSRMDPNWSQEDKVRNLVPMIQRNAIEFQEELTTLQPFHIHCMELQMPLLEEFIRALPPDQMTPARRDGLAKMRNGYAQMLTGMLQNMGDANFSVGYRGAVTNAIADASPALVSVLSLAQRAQLLEVVKQSESSTPSDFKAARARIEKALKNPACSELCAF